ncbi:MAG: carboxypeptidase-like regulatory domain-containing protein, partial [Candidatus Thermoplasmatota archaeon]
MGRVSVAMLCAVSALLAAGCAGTQSQVGDIVDAVPEGVLAGVVVDAAVRPIEAAEIALTGPGGNQQRSSTDANGTFRFTDLIPGTYAVEASKPRHLSAHTLAQVTSDRQGGPLVQLVLEVQTDELPFVVQVAWEGYIGCAFSLGNLCSAPGQAGYDVMGDQSAHLFFDEFVSVGRIPTLIQGEAVWEATTPTSERLKPIYGWSTPEHWQQLSYDGTFFAVSQTSPTFDRVSNEQAVQAKIGTESGLVVEFYSGGL